MNKRLFDKSISRNVGTVLAVFVDERADKVSRRINCIFNRSHRAQLFRDDFLYVLARL
jgi:hypothetical protein